MPRKKTQGLTDAELRLMEVLWEKGSATVAEVAACLPKNAPLAYTTVLTTLRILEQKGHVRHIAEGRAFVYRPAIGRDRARENAVAQLLRRFFEGRPELLMLSLMESKKINARELAALRKRIEESKS